MNSLIEGGPRDRWKLCRVSQESLSSSDIAGLVRLARRCLPDFRFDSELIEEKLFPRNRGADESLVIGVRGDTIVAAAAYDIHAVNERRIGGLRSILVDPFARRAGLGAGLVTAVEEDLTQRGVNGIWLYCSVPNYLYPGAPANDISIANFADKLGYKCRLSTQDIIVDLQMLKALPNPQGIVLKQFVSGGPDHFVDDLRTFVKREFPAFLDEVESVLRKNDPIAHVAYSDRKVVGFCVAGAFNASMGAVGPAAVLRSHRGGDVFRCLVSSNMRSLIQRGHSFARMQWADSRSPSFYRRWFDGFVSEQYAIYVKQIR